GLRRRRLGKLRAQLVDRLVPARQQSLERTHLRERRGLAGRGLSSAPGRKLALTLVERRSPAVEPLLIGNERLPHALEPSCEIVDVAPTHLVIIGFGPRCDRLRQSARDHVERQGEPDEDPHDLRELVREEDRRQRVADEADEKREREGLKVEIAGCPRSTKRDEQAACSERED